MASQFKSFILIVAILGCLVTLSYTVNFDSSDFADLVKLKNMKRSFDGRGNNLNHNDWGSPWTYMQRLADNMYADGKTIARQGPNPRKVSNVIGEQSSLHIKNSDQNLNMLWVLFGQFVDHDLSRTHQEWDETRDRDQPIIVQAPQFGEREIWETGSQIPFRTSRYDISCVDIKEQISDVTPWLDLSTIYGTDEENFNNNYRTNINGRLKVTVKGQFNLLPKDNGGGFMTGDWRGRSNYILQAIHTIFHNFHNQMADQIVALDNADGSVTLNDQDIFTIARNLNIAVFQHIVFDQYLQILLGDYVPAYSGYDDEIKPWIFNELPTAAMRFGHTMLAESIKLIDHQGQLRQIRTLDNLQGNKFDEENDFLHQIVLGAMIKKAKERSCTYVDQMRNQIVHGNTQLDIYAIDIKRGREHGLPTYGQLHKDENLGEILTFVGFSQNTQVNNNLTNLYSNPSNMDLIVGINCEQDHGNSQLGQLGTKIVSKSLNKIRSADRFWYERIAENSQDLVFSPNIVSKIKEFSFRDVIIESIPDLATQFSGQGWYDEIDDQ